MSLLAPFKNLKAHSFESSWEAPANIAFVKYWGKKGHQIPANPSLSMTLKECVTKTHVQFVPSDALSVELKLAGIIEERFALKIKNYLASLTNDLPWLKNVSLKIETENTFPHGAGIASSASGLAALSLCLTEYLFSMTNEVQHSEFERTASYLARLASGSASRSIYGGFTTWGESQLPGSSDLFATSFAVHPELSQLKDSVLVISAEEKTVSSRAGHDRMKEHAFSSARFTQASSHFSSMTRAMQEGDVVEMGRILESEALSLHAMMLTSPEPFTLFRPNSLHAIELIWDFRKQTGLPLYFTLDAGPNLHLIYPASHKNKIKTFITHELAPLAVKVIDDEKGEGPVRC